MNKKFRWHYFIDKPFQLRFIGRFSILILVCMGFFLLTLGIVNYYRFNKGLYFQQTTDPAKLKIIDSQPDKEKAKDTTVLNKYFDINKTQNLYQLYWKPIVAVSIIYIIIIAVFGLFISHKMAGPVYRIKRTLEEATAGKIDIKTLRFRLRKKDELQDLVAALNKFLEKK